MAICLTDHSARALLNAHAQQTSVRISRALASRAACAVELRGAPADLGRISPPPGTRMLLTHAAAPDPAWARHGYASLVRRLAPTHFYALDGGRYPPATAVGTSAPSTITAPALTSSADGDLPAATAFSVAGWARFTLSNQPNRYPDLASRRDPDAGYACGWYLVARRDEQNLELTIDHGATGARVRSAPGTFRPTSSDWVHVAATMDAASIRLYVGGRLLASAATAGFRDDPSCPGGVLTLGGGHSRSVAFAGLLDDWAVWIGRA